MVDGEKRYAAVFFLLIFLATIKKKPILQDTKNVHELCYTFFLQQTINKINSASTFL